MRMARWLSAWSCLGKAMTSYKNEVQVRSLSIPFILYLVFNVFDPDLLVGLDLDLDLGL